MLNISVIIPVYNAKDFVRRAVESAVFLPEVDEVILIDDGYPDGALAICRQLQKEFHKVKVFQHPNGENKGAGASRNLGVQMASCKYIAFLDADDFYLPNRFEGAIELMRNDSIDGVYDAVGIQFLDNSFLEMDLKNGLTTIPARPSGKELFETLLQSGHGHFHTNGILVKKELIERAGYFNTGLRLHQDNDLWIKLAYLGNIVPGITDRAVAIRCVHGGNRIKNRNFKSKGELYSSLFKFFLDKELSQKAAFRLLRKFIIFNKRPFSGKLMNLFSNVVFATKTMLLHPRFILKLLHSSSKNYSDIKITSEVRRH